MSEQTINEAGGCKHCGCKTFTVLEELLYRCTVQSGVLVQDDGALEQSEILNVACTNCRIAYGTDELGEVKLKPIGA